MGTMGHASDMDTWFELLIASFARPREAARRLLAAAPAQSEVIAAAVAVTACGVVLSFLAVLASGGPADPVSALILGNPILGATAQLIFAFAIAGVTAYIGRSFGGTGDFWGALTLVVWLNAVLVVLQTIQLVALVFAPPFAGLLAAAGLFWALWAFANFITELHGFQNPLFVMGGVILSAIALFFLLAMALSMMGLTPQGLS